MRRLRVLQVIASLAPQFGGPSAAVGGLVLALRDRGHDVEIMTTDRGGVPEPIDDVPLHVFRQWRPGVYGVAPGLAVALRRRIDEFDVVHVHSLYLFHTLVACGLARRRGIPYVLRPHGTLNPYHRAQKRSRKALYDRLVERRNLEQAAAIHYVSESERAHAEKAGVRGRAFVAPLGVDVDPVDLADVDAVDAKHAELRGRRLVTFLGRLTAKKGLDLLVDAFAEVAGDDAAAHLVIAGPDDEGLGDELRRRVASRGLENRVSFLGVVTTDKWALLRRSSVFVLPSEDENFAVAVVEAMAAGVPVVVTREVATADEIEAGDAGLVVERTVGAVTAALAQVLGDPLLGDRLGANAARLAREQFSWRHRVVDVERMYEFALVGGVR